MRVRSASRAGGILFWSFLQFDRVERACHERTCPGRRLRMILLVFEWHQLVWLGLRISVYLYKLFRSRNSVRSVSENGHFLQYCLLG